MEEEEKREGGITFMEILHYIGKKIWWILGISVLVALVTGLVMMFAVSPTKVSYEISFMIEYPNQYAKDENEQLTETLLYPDGTIFRYETIVYSKNLNAVRDSDEEFKNINTEKMASSQDIKIREQTLEVGTNVQNRAIYTIEVTGNYFKNNEQATKFLRALGEYAESSIIEKVAERKYDASLNGYETAVTYERQLSLLKDQLHFLLDQYDLYAEMFGTSFKYEGETLNYYRTEVYNLYTDADGRFNTLEKDLKNNRYMNDKQKVEDIQMQISALEDEKNLNEALIEKLNKQKDEFIKDGSLPDDGLDSFTQNIVTLTIKNGEIEWEIDKLSKSIEGILDSTAFVAKLNALRDTVAQQTEICEQLISSLFHDKTNFNYAQDSALAASGGNTLLYTVLAFVIAFVVASIVFCFMGYYKDKRAVLQAEAQTKEPLQEQETLELEAAVSEESSEKKKKE